MPTKSIPTRVISEGNLLDTYDSKTWRSAVRRTVNRRIPKHVVTFLRNANPDEMGSDSMNFLRDAWDKSGEGDFDSMWNEVTKSFLADFFAIRAYHCCKPRSLESYFRHGLLPLSREFLEKEANSVLGDAVTSNAVKASVAASDLDTREGRVYFDCDAKGMIDDAGHYLIYGPESMDCLDGLIDGYEMRARRKAVGIPTMFDCAVPLKMLTEEHIDELLRLLVTVHFKLNSRIKSEWAIDTHFAFWITTTLPSRYLLGHQHPAKIPDPLRLRAVYHNPHARCDWCSSGTKNPAGWGG